MDFFFLCSAVRPKAFSRGLSSTNEPDTELDGIYGELTPLVEDLVLRKAGMFCICRILSTRCGEHLNEDGNLFWISASCTGFAY